MSTLRQAAEQALEALEHAEKDVADFQRLNTDQVDKAIVTLRQALEAEQQFDWPKLDKPARVNGGTFGIGVSAKLVVEAGQRAHRQHVRVASLTHEQMVEEERNRRKLWDLLLGPIEAEQQAEPVAWMYDSTFRQAAQQALEALSELIDCGTEAWGNHRLCVRAGLVALNDLRQALKAEQEAVNEVAAQKQDKPVTNASSWFSLVMNAAAEIEDAANCLRDEDAKRVAMSAARYYRDAANSLYAKPHSARQMTSEKISALCVLLAK